MTPWHLWLGAGVVAILAGHAPPAAAEELSPAPPVVSITERTYSLPLRDAERLLREVPSDDRRYARLREMTSAGLAKLERLQMTRIKAETHGEAGNYWELRAVTPLSPPIHIPQGGNFPWPDFPADFEVPREFELLIVGHRFDAKPMIMIDGGIQLDISIQTTGYAGDRAVSGHSRIKQPLLEISRLNTAVVVRDGEPFFVGTETPYFAPALDGKRQSGRVWLNFIVAEIVRLDGKKPLPGSASLLARARTIRIPEMVLRDATVSEALDYLRKTSRGIDREKKGIPFKLEAPAEAGEKKISLHLTDVPLLDAARYLAQVAGLRVLATESALVLSISATPALPAELSPLRPNF